MLKHIPLLIPYSTTVLIVKNTEGIVMVHQDISLVESFKENRGVRAGAVTLQFLYVLDSFVFFSRG